MKRIAITLCVTLIGVSPLLAQASKRKPAPAAAKKVAAPAPVEVVLRSINDRRSSGSFSSLDVNLALPAYVTGQVEASRVLVRLASDDTGRSLLDAEGGEPALAANRYLVWADEEILARPMTVDFSIQNPDRRAASLKEISGEIELFVPSRDPNSIVTLAKFLSYSGKALSHPGLKENGVTISVVSSEQLAAEKKKFMDQKRKQALKEGADESDLEWMSQGWEYEFISPDEGEIVLKISDPNKRINELVYIDGDGEKQQAILREHESGYATLFTWGEGPQPDWSLRISLATPKSLIRHSFALKDLPLP